MYSKKINAGFLVLLAVGTPNIAQSADATLEIKYILGSNNGTCSANNVNHSIDSNGPNYKLNGLKCTSAPPLSETFDSAPKQPIATLTVDDNGSLQTIDVIKSEEIVDSNNKKTYAFTLQAKNSTITPTPIPTKTPILTPSQVPTVTPVNNLVKVIDAHNTNETYLPGCAGIVNGSSFDCRFLGSMQNESYAIKFSFAEIKGSNKDHDIPIQTITRDYPEDEKYKRFDMAVSTIPGDFEAKDMGASAGACIKKGAQDGSDMSIYGKQAVPGVNIGDNDCPLIPGKQYYINVKASEPSCQYTDGTFPTRLGCMVTVVTRLPTSNQ